MKSPKGDKIHPIMYDSPASSFRSPSPTFGTPSKGEYGKKYELSKEWGKPGYRSPSLPPPAVYGRPRRRSSCSPCYILTVMFSILVILVILSGLVVLVFYAVFEPRMPVYSVQNVRIAELNVTDRAGGPISSPSDLHDPVLNTDIAFTIRAQNPNSKLGIHYQNVSVYVAYQGTTFAQSQIAPFYQGSNSTTDVVADMKATNSPLSQSQGQALQTAITNNDVPLFARITVKGALQIGSWTTPSMWIHVVCNVRASPPTAPQGAQLLSKSCKWVHWFKSSIISRANVPIVNWLQGCWFLWEQYTLRCEAIHHKWKDATASLPRQPNVSSSKWRGRHWVDFTRSCGATHLPISKLEAGRNGINFFLTEAGFFCQRPSCTTSSIMTMYIMTAQFCLSRLAPGTPLMLLKDPSSFTSGIHKRLCKRGYEASSLVRSVIYPAGGIKPATLEVVNQQSSYSTKTFSGNLRFCWWDRRFVVSCTIYIASILPCTLLYVSPNIPDFNTTIVFWHATCNLQSFVCPLIGISRSSLKNLLLFHVWLTHP